MSSRVAPSLLSNAEYHIEFHDYLTNHAKHAVVGLEGLGAPDDVVQAYWRMYTERTPYGYTLDAREEARHVVNEDNLPDFVGNKRDFEALRAFFDAEERQLGVAGLVAKYAPRFAKGSAGALTHGIIHLGWALDAGNRDMAVEGLAYLAHTFVDVHPERFQHRAHGDAGARASLTRTAAAFRAGGVAAAVAALTSGHPVYDAARGFHPELKPAGFQWDVAAVLAHGLPLFLELPAWLDDAPVATVLEELYKAVAVLYLVSAGAPGRAADGAGGFVALHFVTALWGAEHTVRGLPAEQQRAALQCVWAAVVALQATLSVGWPPADALERTWRKYDVPADAFDGELPAWEDTVRRAFWETEEHNIKLVYVCKQLAARYGDWAGFRAAAGTFTTTPDVGPGRGAFSA